MNWNQWVLSSPEYKRGNYLLGLCIIKAIRHFGIVSRRQRLQ